jgi:hypothetical protein
MIYIPIDSSSVELSQAGDRDSKNCGVWEGGKEGAILALIGIFFVPTSVCISET